MSKFNFLLSMLLIVGCTSDKPKTIGYKFSVKSEDRVLSGKENWKGEEDCSFTTTIIKESLGLRVFVNVVDDELIAEAEKVHDKDGVEIYIDTRPYRLKQKNRYMKGVFQAIVFPCFSKVHPNTALFFPKHYDSTVPGTKVISKIKTHSNGYIINVFFPFFGFEKNHYSIKNSFSIDVSVNDADSDGKSQMIWAGKTNNWESPQNLRSITLE